jgi:hypothetical protein
VFVCEGAQEEVVSEPTEEDEGGAGDCAESEYDELWVVVGDVADVVFGEGGVVVVVLGYPVDYDEAEDCADCPDFVEEEGGEGASEHGVI